MKKIITAIISTIIMSMITCSNSFAQVPQGMNYQAIVRDASGNPILNTHVCLRITIHSGSGTGPVQYQELDTVLTNGFGLATIKVGMGDSVQGTFNAVPWNNGNQ